MIRPATALIGALMLSACSASDIELSSSGLVGSPISEGPTLAILDAVVLMHTEKTIGDHVLSLVTGKSCSTIRAQNNGTYCEAHLAPPEPPAPVFCYQTLGDVDCYATPAYASANDYMVGNTAPRR